MKKVLLIVLSTLLVFSLGSCKKKEKAEKKEEKKVLIAYYSHTGNTKVVAEQIYTAFGGDIFEITLTNPYPPTEKEVIAITKEEREQEILPEIANNVENMAQYDVIFIGSPIWYGTASTPVISFLKSYDFSNKTIIPFYTSGGGGEGTYVNDIKSLCEGATFLQSFGSTRNEREEGSAEQKIADYLSKLEF